jgi:RNA-binding protein 39
MRVNERDLYSFFRSECGCKVVDVILMRDKRTGRHKGCAYIELARLEDIPRALEWNDKPPSFQRFPIAVKAPDLSFITTDVSAATVEALTEAAMYPSLSGSTSALNVYVGNIDTNVTQPQLQAIFSQFGDLEKVSLQFDIATGISKGFAFFGFRDPKVANLCIQVMSGQQIAGRSLYVLLVISFATRKWHFLGVRIS